MSSTFNPLQILREQPQCPPQLRPAWPGQPRGESRGWHVKLLRRCLAAAGCYSDVAPGKGQRSKREELLDPATPVSDVYDTGLAGVVRKYQERAGLKADGICGPKTWRHLAGWKQPDPIRRDPANDGWPFPKNFCAGILDADPQGAADKSIRAEMVRLARQELHVREQGHNRGSEVERILRQAEGSPGDAWCAAFCEALLEWACQNLGLPVPFEIGLSCSALVKRAEAAGRIVQPGHQQPGDLWVLKGGPTGWKHVGLIESLSRADLADQTHGRHRQAGTIEGNTNAAGSSEGDGVYAKTRSLDRAKCAVVRVV